MNRKSGGTFGAATFFHTLSHIPVIPHLMRDLERVVSKSGIRTKPKFTFGIHTKGELWFCKIPHQVRDDTIYFVVTRAQLAPACR